MKPNVIKFLAFSPFILWFLMGFGLSWSNFNTILFGLVFFSLVSITSYPFRFSRIFALVFLALISASLYVEGLNNQLFGISNYIKFLVGYNLYYLCLLFISKSYLNLEQTKTIYKKLILKAMLIIVIIVSMNLFESFLSSNMKSYLDNDILISNVIFYLKLIISTIIFMYKGKSLKPTNE